jgi:L-threonylcarbamoyladenylate synthase
MEVEVASARSAEGVERAARRAANVLRAGGLVVHPTETVYGIGGDGSAGSNQLISRVKRRKQEQPLLLLTPDLATLHAFVSGIEWPDEAEELARRYWPGPLTLVVRCPEAPAGLRGPGDGVAVRISPHPIVAAVLRHWRRPLTSTSANLSGRPPGRTLREALAVFRGRADLEDVDHPVLGIDAGASGGAPPSTIVSFVESPPRLIREGPVGRKELESCLPGLR